MAASLSQRGNELSHPFPDAPRHKSPELLLSPAMPSSTARAGGIFMPIIKFLSKGVNGEPETGGRKKIGAFLVQNQLQVGPVSFGGSVRREVVQGMCV